MNPSELVRKARQVKENAYSPYSEYNVGAAVVANGVVYTGVNIEGITFDMTSHAERSAMVAAISDGNTDFEALAISTETEDGQPPCGTCRQFIAEFCGDDFKIYSDLGSEGDTDPAFDTYALGDVFPEAFRPAAVEDATDNDN